MTLKSRHLHEYRQVHRCRTFPLLLAQMGVWSLCGLGVWRKRTNPPPCCPPKSNPTTYSWKARPDGSGRWDTRMATQHLTRDLVRPSRGMKQLAQTMKICASWNHRKANKAEPSGIISWNRDFNWFFKFYFVVLTTHLFLFSDICAFFVNISNKRPSLQHDSQT